MASKLYIGELIHARHHPRAHRFSYRVFMPYVKLQEVGELVEHIPFWSTRRWAMARFDRADFLGDPSKPLVDEVRRRIWEETGRRHTGPIYLLANWRYFGFQTNPIACYYCYDETDETLEYLVAEVTNTPWGERRSYVLTPPPDNAPLNVDFDKTLHVSPFNPMDMIYRWRSNVPGETLSIHLANLRDGERIFDATLSLRAREWNRFNLLSVLAQYPVMTLKVFLAIYWQALRLFIKRVPLQAHPNRG